MVARSSIKVEIRSMTLGIHELPWLKIILENLNIEWKGPIRLYCDNKSAINIARNPMQHDHTKHIEIYRHFMKEKFESNMYFVCDYKWITCRHGHHKWQSSKIF